MNPEQRCLDERFLRGVLSGQESWTLREGQHLEECASCSEVFDRTMSQALKQVQREMGLDRVVSDHLSEEQLLLFYDHGVNHPESEGIAHHLADCNACRQAFLQLKGRLDECYEGIELSGEVEEALAGLEAGGPGEVAPERNGRRPLGPWFLRIFLKLPRRDPETREGGDAGTRQVSILHSPFSILHSPPSIPRLRTWAVAVAVLGLLGVGWWLWVRPGPGPAAGYRVVQQAEPGAEPSPALPPKVPPAPSVPGPAEGKAGPAPQPGAAPAGPQESPPEPPAPGGAPGGRGEPEGPGPGPRSGSLRLASVVGQPQVVEAGGSSRPAQVGALVLAGEGLRTGPGDRVGLSWPNGSQAELRERSELEAASLGRVRLRRGEVWCRIRPGLGKFEVETVAATAVVQGTEFGVQVAAGQRAVLTVLSGRVEFVNRWGKVEATALTQTSATPETAPVEPQRVGTLKEYLGGMLSTQRLTLRQALNEGRWMPCEENDPPKMENGKWRMEGGETEPEGDLAAALAVWLREYSGYVRQPAPDQKPAELRARLHAAGFEARGRQALQQQPRDALAHLLTGHVHLLFGRPSDAAQEYRRAQELDPRNAAAANNLGVLAQMADDFKQAQQEYRKALSSSPKAAIPRTNLGDLYLQSGLFSRAEEEFQQALQTTPFFRRARYGLGWAQALQDHFAEASQVAQELQQEAPNRPDGYELQGWIFHFQGDLYQAHRQYLEANRRDPHCALMALGQVYQFLGDLEEARKWFTAVLAEEPGHVEAHWHLGWVLRSLEQPEEAEKHFAAARKGEGEELFGLIRLGLGYSPGSLEEDRRAEQILRRAVARYPQHEAGYLALAEFLSRRRRLRDAETWLQKAQQIHPRYVWTYLKLAEVTLRQGRLEEARQWLARAERLPVVPKEWHLRLGLGLLGPGAVQQMKGRIALAEKRWAEAEQSFQRALELDPDNPSILAHLGELYVRAGRLEEGERVLRQVVEGGPRLAQGTDAYGRARSQWLELMNGGSTWTVEPRNPDAANALAERLLEEKRQLPLALRLAQQAAEKEPENQTYHTTLAHAQFLSGQVSEAKATLTRAFDQTWERSGGLAVTYSEATWSLARKIFQAAQAEEEFFDLMRRYAPQYPVLHGYLAQAWRERGNVEEAVREYGLHVRQCDPKWAWGGLFDYVARQLGRPEQYREWAEQWIREEPQNPHAYLALSQGLLFLQEKAACVRTLKTALRLATHSSRPDTVYWYAYRQYDQLGLAAEALATAQELIRRYPGFSDAYLYAGRLEEYVASLQEQWSQDPEDAELQVDLVGALFQVGRFAEALPLAQKVVETGSASHTQTWLLYWCGRMCERQGEVEEARAYYRRVLEFATDAKSDEAADALKGLIRTDSPGRAAYQKQLAGLPDGSEADYRLLTAQGYLRAGKPEQALLQLGWALEVQPTHWQAPALLKEAWGCCPDAATWARSWRGFPPAALGGVWREALSWVRAKGWGPAVVPVWEEALREAPADLSVRVLLAAGYSWLERKERAKQVLAPLLRDPPADPGPLAIIGQLLLEQGETEAAVEWLRSHGKQGAADAIFQDTYGRALSQAGRPEEAMAAMEKAWRLNEYAPALGGLPCLWGNICTVYQQAGALERLLALQRERFAAAPDFGTAWRIAAVAKKRGDSEQHLHWAKQALALSPNLYTYNGLGGALEALGRLEEARGAYRQALQAASGDEWAVAAGVVLPRLLEIGTPPEWREAWEKLRGSKVEGASYVSVEALAEAAFWLGELADRVGASEEAGRWYRQAQELAPQSQLTPEDTRRAWIALRQGKTLEQAGELEEARQAYEKVLRYEGAAESLKQQAREGLERLENRE